MSDEGDKYWRLVSFLFFVVCLFYIFILIITSFELCFFYPRLDEVS